MGERVQWLKFLLCKHEDQSWIFITHVKKLGVVVHTYVPTTRARGRRWLPGAHGEPMVCLVSFGLVRDPVSVNQGNGA